MANGKGTAMNDIDLDKIDLASLKKLAEAASEKFNSRKKDELKHMVAGWLADAQAVGYSAADVMAELRARSGQGGGRRGRAPRADKGSTTPPKYKGPNGELWSGRGQPPNWMKPYLAAGKKKEDFLIAK
jgi:DNA-binding protein H-NS